MSQTRKLEAQGEILPKITMSRWWRSRPTTNPKSHVLSSPSLFTLKVSSPNHDTPRPQQRQVSLFTHGEAGNWTSRNLSVLFPVPLGDRYTSFPKQQGLCFPWCWRQCKDVNLGVNCLASYCLNACEKMILLEITCIEMSQKWVLTVKVNGQFLWARDSGKLRAREQESWKSCWETAFTSSLWS